VVLDGLKAGEQVMVDGFQKLQPGATVKPVPWKAPGAKPAARARRPPRRRRHRRIRPAASAASAAAK
jgi:membrane fusion protein (multidrug efflux system)